MSQKPVTHTHIGSAKLSEKLWCDLKTPNEKYNWLLMGLGYKTGVVAHAMQTDLANDYQVMCQLQTEHADIVAQRDELLAALKGLMLFTKPIKSNAVALNHCMRLIERIEQP